MRPGFVGGRYRHRVIRTIDETCEVMVFKFFFFPAGDLFSDISPVAQARTLRRLDEEKFFVCAPFGVDDWQGALFDDTVGMPGMFGRVCRKACALSARCSKAGEHTLDAEVVVVALWGSTADAGCARDVD